MKVSVIVPNYNHEAYLRRRLDSIFNQTYTDFEVILLDDCSKDNSVSILREYAVRPQVSHFIVNTVNTGSPFKQWRKGIELASSDYIWIAESDDYCEHTFLEKLVTNFSVNVGIVFSSLVLVENNREKIYKALEEGFHEGNKLLSKEMITGNLFVNANCVLFNKKYIDTSQLSIIESYRICGDWSLWNHILSKTNAYFVNEPLSYYRKHNEATTENLYNKSLFYEEAIRNSKQCIRMLGGYYHHNQRAITFYTKLIHASTIPKKDKDYLLELLKETFKTNTYKNLLRRFLRKLKLS